MQRGRDTKERENALEHAPSVGRKKGCKRGASHPRAIISHSDRGVDAEKAVYSEKDGGIVEMCG